jgi:hypothetical protein
MLYIIGSGMKFPDTSFLRSSSENQISYWKGRNSLKQSGHASGSDQGKRSHVRAPFFNILKLSLFCQTGDFIVAPKLGDISVYRRYRHQVATPDPFLLLDDHQGVFTDVLNKNDMRLDW